jgi:WD40 repeat protein
MKVCLTITAISASLLSLGCGPEGEMIAPPTRSDEGMVSLSSQRYTAWSDPKPLETVNQSGINDQQPALSKDGLSLYFASNRKTNPSDNVLDLNIWVARRACTDGCSWTAVDVVPGVNTDDFLDVSPSLSRDGHQLFFSSQRPHGHCSPPQTQCNNRDLWVSFRGNVHDDFGWGEPMNLGDGINSTDEEVAPSYFENEDAGIPQLFFNRGALGGDIYMSELQNGVWGAPDEDGVEELNTAGTDQRPSISHDGLEIYFYSDRDGANRLWMARRGSVSSDWSPPVRVDFPTSDQEAIMPFIHSHGRTETLVFVRPFAPLAARDLWIMQRTLGRSE